MLPARMTPIEEYFLVEDCPEFPMTVSIRLRFSGRLERESFDLAVCHVVGRHPLLRAVVDESGGNKIWVECPGWEPKVHWGADCDEGGWPEYSFIDVRKEPGTRIWVVHRDGWDEVVVQVHHCSADALGLCRFTEDLLISYTRFFEKEEGGSSIQLRKVNSQQFHRRSTPSIPPWMFSLMAHRWHARVKDFLQIVRRKSSELLPSTLSLLQPEATASPCVRILRFDREQTQRIKARSKELQVTVNSILLRDLFLTTQEWREALGVNREDDLLRFCVPVNLRTSDDRDLPVSNVLSLLFLDRRDAEMQDPDALMHGIQRELHATKKKDLRLTFITILAVGRQLPGGLKRWLKTNKCWATCIFSSLGVLFRGTPLTVRDGHLIAGDLTLENWDLVPPMRRKVGLTICPYTYAGRLSIVFNYDRTRMSGDQLSLMLNNFLARIDSSVARPLPIAADKSGHKRAA